MTLDRNELITMFVLDMVADGYEDIDQIVKDVTNLGERCGMEVHVSEIIHALNDLVARQLVKAYRFPLDGSPTEEGFEMPPCGKIGEYHFKITSEGMKLEMADYPPWPFDEDNNLKEEWVPPR